MLDARPAGWSNNRVGRTGVLGAGVLTDATATAVGAEQGLRLGAPGGSEPVKCACVPPHFLGKVTAAIATLSDGLGCAPCDAHTASALSDAAVDGVPTQKSRRCGVEGCRSRAPQRQLRRPRKRLRLPDLSLGLSLRGVEVGKVKIKVSLRVRFGSNLRRSEQCACRPPAIGEWMG